MTEPKNKETPTGLSPSADQPEQKHRKVVIGRGLVIFIACVAIAAFMIYAFIAAYGIIAGS